MNIERIDKIIEMAMKLKKVMQKRGIRAARAKCELCADGYIHGRLAGRKDHLHMHCDGCDAAMIQ